MDQYPWRERIGLLVRIQQIIVAALIAGCVFLLGIAATIATGRSAPQEPLLIYVLPIGAVPILAARAIVPGIVLSRARHWIARGEDPPTRHTSPSPAIVEFLQQGGDAARLAVALQTSRIISVALLEGLAFFATIVFLVEGSLPALAVAVVTILCIAWHFPTQRRVVAAVEDQLRILDQERLLNGWGPR